MKRNLIVEVMQKGLEDVGLQVRPEERVADSIVEIKLLHGLAVHYRPGTSDERVLEEVITKATYRRVRMGFDVYPGETWLDLGANIGAFALYCKLRGATAVCYEPDPDCFALLARNVPEFEKYRTAVTAQAAATIPFWRGRAPTDHYRATAYPTPSLPRHPLGELPNRHGAFLTGLTFDGVKMDIEGSEAGLLDAGFIPSCQKLVLEYHLSRDPSMANLQRRLDWLRRRFRNVAYPAELDRLVAAGGSAKTFFDRLIHCIA
jgi:FkbM family methyltransferase